MLAQQSPAEPTPEAVGQIAAVLFYGFALLTALSAWAVVLSSNIVRMAVYLLLTLGGAAGLYFILNAELLAAVQLIVYAGGTLILIVFGVMLTSKSPFARLKVKMWEQMLGIAIGLAIVACLVLAMVNTTLPPVSSAAAPGPTGPGYGQVEMVGRALLSTYLVPFEVAGVLLLVVMVGAAYMARRRAR